MQTASSGDSLPAELKKLLEDKARARANSTSSRPIKSSASSSRSHPTSISASYKTSWGRTPLQISIEKLVFDGVGPFAGKEVFDFGDSRRVIVYAPNGHGKTVAIDLVRWLLLGDRAGGSFRSLHPGSIINWERESKMDSGSVTAIFHVEGRGRYRVMRKALPRKGGDSLEVARWQDDEAAFKEVPAPQAFLMRFFPAERVGFNLLTGEHIASFQEELRGEDVRRSLERLLQFPEMASARQVLDELAIELAQKREQHEKQRKRSKDAAAAVAKLAKNVKSYKEARENSQRRINSLREEIKQLDEQLGALRSGNVSKDLYDRTVRDIKATDEALSKLREEARDSLAQAWRRLAVRAAKPRIEASIQALDRYDAELQEWQGRQGQLKLLNEVIRKELCVCLRPIDRAVVEKIQGEIARIQSAQPKEPPSVGVTDWTLRSWASEDRFEPLVARLEKIVLNSGELSRDRARSEHERTSLEAALDQGALNQIRTLEAQRGKLEAEQKQAIAEKEKAIELLTEAQNELEAAERASAGKKTSEDFGTVSDRARAFADLFKEVLDDAIPWYRERLQVKVQDIFRKLYQKDSEAIVEFDARSSVPRIRLPSQDDKVKVQTQMSPGEKMRLGLAFLIGLREVASERPFLMLDAPFSELDDAGIRAVLRLLKGLDSQVIIFTKNRLKPDEFQLVSSMDPTVIRMDWISHVGRATKGHTTVSTGSLEMLEVMEES